MCIPWPGHTKDCTDVPHCLLALHFIFRFGIGVLDQPLTSPGTQQHCGLLLPQGRMGQMQRSNTAYFRM